MPQRWKPFLLSVLAASLVFASCKKQYSEDTVLPTSYTPSIIIGSDNMVVYALNPTDGTKNWELGLSSPVLASPIVYGGMVYVASSSRDTLYKINAKTGELIRRLSWPGGGTGAKATPIADGNRLYIASLDGAMYVIDTGTGVVKWSFSTGGGPLVASPTIYNGKLYFASTQGGVLPGANVYCFEKVGGLAPGSGSVGPLWTYHADGASFESSPSIASPYVLIGSTTDSSMYCIYTDVPVTDPVTVTGILRWKFKTKGPIRSSPATIAGTCIFGSDDFHVYCLDTAIDPDMGITVPEVRWVDSMHSEVTSSPVAYSQVVYVAAKDYKLYALNIINGGIKWSFKSNGIITSSPLVYNGTVYIGSFDKNLYALDSARGTLKWTKDINGQIECSPVIDDLTKLNGFNSQVSGWTN